MTSLTGCRTGEDGEDAEPYERKQICGGGSIEPIGMGPRSQTAVVRLQGDLL